MNRYIKKDDILRHSINIDGKDYVEIEKIKNTKEWNVRENIQAYWTKEITGPDIFDYKFTCSNCKCSTPNGAYKIAPDWCPVCGAEMCLSKEG